MKSVLIISYTFPPFPGIGGRRWAKFAKYLSANHFEIFVIGAQHRSAKQSNWTKDIINNSHIHYYPVKTKFFSFFHDHDFSFLKKIKYKLYKFYLEHTSKGNFYDKALASNELFYKKAKQLIYENKIKNIVISIAPNRLVDIGVKLKKDFPDINFIVDIRDPWNILVDDWDHKYLNEKQKSHELQAELNAVKASDKIFSVVQAVIDFYAENFPNRKGDFLFIPNGFDKEELNEVQINEENKELKYFVYAGVLYDISIHLFEEFLQQVSLLLNDDTAILNSVQFHFYIPNKNQFQQLVEKHSLNDYVKFFNQVPLNEIQKIIANAEGCLLFLPPKFEFSLSTKFYEYVSHGKKILLFSNPGEVAGIIEKHNLGYVMLSGKMYKPFAKALKEIIVDKKSPEHTFPLEDYSVENLTKKIIPYFK